MLLLEKPGCRVNFPEKQGCYSQPAINSGYTREAIPRMRNLIAALEDNDGPIISSADSCTYTVRSYPTYLADEPEWTSRIAKATARMQDLTFSIVNRLGVVDVGADLQGRVVCYPPYSPARKSGVESEPFTLLKNVRGPELLALVEQDTCCGFDDTFSVKMVEISGEMVKEKVAHLMETRPEYLIGTDVSYLLNISGRLQWKRQKVEVMHITEVLMSR